MRLNALDWTALGLIVIGGLNWGILGIFDYNVIDHIFGDISTATRVVYGIVGFAALYLIIALWVKASNRSAMAARP